ncbi:hypothetical protein ACJX0J_013847, partial [Zea mays]
HLIHLTKASFLHGQGKQILHTKQYIWDTFAYALFLTKFIIWAIALYLQTQNLAKYGEH